jgi:hypothetical protein
LTPVNVGSGVPPDAARMPSSTERLQTCRAHAHQCRAWADLTEHEAAKEEFLRVAVQWEQLAREIEDIERMHAFVNNETLVQRPR